MRLKTKTDDDDDDYDDYEQYYHVQALPSLDPDYELKATIPHSGIQRLLTQSRIQRRVTQRSTAPTWIRRGIAFRMDLSNDENEENDEEYYDDDDDGDSDSDVDILSGAHVNVTKRAFISTLSLMFGLILVCAALAVSSNMCMVVRIIIVCCSVPEAYFLHGALHRRFCEQPSDDDDDDERQGRIVHAAEHQPRQEDGIRRRNRPRRSHSVS